jgi:Lipocalin-like domain
MKNLSLLALFAMFSFLTSCTKDYKLIDGTWTVTSWVEDGEELLTPDDYASVEMVFTESDKDQGTFTWTINYGPPDNDKEIIPGSYTLDTDNDKITLTIDTESYTFDYDVSKDELKISGTPDGSTVVIKAVPK